MEAGLLTLPLFSSAASRPNITLRDYQEDAIRTIKWRLECGVRRQLVVMATGLGKGVIIGHVPTRTGLFPCLVTVGRIAIVDQLAQHLQRANPHRTVEIEQAENYASKNADIVVASTATLGAKKARLESWPEDYFRLVQIDEAHHGTSASNVRIGVHFKPDLLVGYTATPFRADGVPLSRIFDEVVTDLDIRWGIAHNWLCDIRAIRVRSTTDISSVRSSLGDLNQKELAQKVNTDERNSLVISAIEQYAEDRQSIMIFCVDKAHAEALASQLLKRGHTATAVLDHTPSAERTKIYDAFRQQRLRILTTVGVLLEGFDAPATDCVVMARPTTSPLVWWQAIGRGTRTHHGKKDLLVIDCLDNCGKHHIITAAKAFGYRDIDMLGMTMTEVDELLKRAEKERIPIKPGDTPQGIEERINKINLLVSRVIRVQTIADAVDIFNAAAIPDEVSSVSMLAWMPINENKYILPAMTTTYALTKDQLGRWTLDNGNINVPLQSTGNPLREADKIVRRLSGNMWKHLHINAKWRRTPASEKQIEVLRKFGFDAMPEKISKGEASQMISYMLSKKKAY